MRFLNKHDFLCCENEKKITVTRPNLPTLSRSEQLWIAYTEVGLLCNDRPTILENRAESNIKQHGSGTNCTESSEGHQRVRLAMFPFDVVESREHVLPFASLGTASASGGDGPSHDHNHYIYPTPGTPLAAPWFGGNRRRRNPIDGRHCGRQFASVSMLRSHAENAHGLVIGLPVTRGCHTSPVCGKTFPELRYLRQYMEKHGEERFVCEKCGQRSRWASTMLRHRRKCKFKPANVLK